MSITGLLPVFTGLRVTAAKVTGCSVNATTGILTKGTSYNLADSSHQSFDAVTFSSDLDNEEISAANATVRNNVPIKANPSVEVREIKAANGGAVALGTFANFVNFLVEVITSDGTNVQLRQGVYLVASLEDEYSEGKSINLLRGVACGLAESVTSGTVGSPPTGIY